MNGLSFELRSNDSSVRCVAFIYSCFEVDVSDDRG